MRWIEIPAHRVLELTIDEFEGDFEYLSEDGTPIQEGQMIGYARRKRDGKLYRPPKYHPHMRDTARLFYLEEV